MDAVVVIPAYNPDAQLKELVEKIWDLGNEVIVVDDGSDAMHRAVFDQIRDISIIIHHAENKGKGAAIRTALGYIQQECWNTGAVGIMDADGQHSPDDMERLLMHVDSGHNKLVLGVRKVNRDMPVKSRLGNMITRNVFRMVSGKSVSDTQTGLRAFRTQMIPEMLKIPGDRYEYETNVLLYMVREQVEIEEVPIRTIYHDQDNSCSHFRAVKDSIRIYRDLLKFAFFSMSSFFLDYMLFVLFHFLFMSLPMGILAANVAARCGSGYYNYHMNTRFVFREKKSWKSASQYIVLAGGILVANSIVLMAYQNIPGISLYIAKVMTEMTLFVISFSVQKLLIYRPGRERKEVSVRI